MERTLRGLRQAYLTVDARSLALFRIALSLVLLYDLGCRLEVLDLFYTNAGLLPNHTLLWRPPAQHVFSLFYVASSRAEALVGFGICGLAYAALLLGLRTKTAQVVTLVCRVSLNSRLAVLENGGDMVINLLLILTLLLPLGRRFSVDALLAGLSSHPPTATHLNRPRADSHNSVLSLAMPLLLLQFAAIYFFNAISKDGEAWKQGSAVHYALHLDKFVTPLGVWMREELPSELLQWLSYGTLGVEWTAFALLVCPAFIRHTRLLLVLVLPLMHLGFALALSLGSFSWAMMTFFTLLITGDHWDAFSAWVARRCEPCTFALPQGDPRWLSIADLLRQFDVYGRIRFEPSDAGLWLQSPAGERRPAAQAVLRALPLGFVPASLLGFPFFRPAARFGRLALGACAWFANWLRKRSPRIEAQGASPGFVGRIAPSLGLLLFGLAVGIEISNDNAAVPHWMRVQRPAWAKAFIEYPRVLQGWRMFAPDPPRQDSMIHVAAVTAQGRRVDPYNEAVSRVAYPDGETVPPRMGQAQFFTMYSNRIPLAHYAAYRQAFEQWLLSYPTRTGNEEDCLTHFTAYHVVDSSPAPGEHKAKPVSRNAFMTYTAPADADCRKLKNSIPTEPGIALR